jgi:hypothetical protein
MNPGLRFLLAARQCEIDELERLAHTSELVGLLGRFTHALQRERGSSNIFVVSRGERFATVRRELVADCDAMQAEVLAAFEQLAAASARVPNGARLFNRIAVVLEGLAGLGELRRRITAQAIAARDATCAFGRLIAGLLAVVFEAADSAGDPEISRALVAMFNFMQGKEFAGQERAFGAAVFAGGTMDAAAQREWRHLIEQQQHCLEVFADFADATALAAEHASHDDRAMAQIERLRRTGWTLSAGRADGALLNAWFDCCTARIDAMRSVEALLASNLGRLSERKIDEAQAQLRDQRSIMESLHREASQGAGALTHFGPRLERAGIGPQLERSLFDLVQEQSRRLQEMGDELATARGALNERKVVERAKGLLMAHRQLSEDEAYKTLRQMAMNQKKRLAEVAEAVLAMAQVLR